MLRCNGRGDARHVVAGAPAHCSRCSVPITTPPARQHGNSPGTPTLARNNLTLKRGDEHGCGWSWHESSASFLTQDST